MKKTILIVILCLIVSTSLVACSNSTAPPGASWADKEIITYDVVNTSNENCGTLTTTLERNPIDKTIDGDEYSSATSRLTINYTNGDESMTVESLLDDFAPLATKKVVSTSEINYQLSSYYSGKYYNYKITEDGVERNGKIKMKSTYIDNDLLYTYLRCYDTDASMSKTLNIPDALNGNYQTVSVASSGVANITIPYPTEDTENPIDYRVVSCTEITISRTEKPIGNGIKIYYSPNNEENTIWGGLSSKEDSVKFPVKIVENNLTYTISSISVS